MGINKLSATLLEMFPVSGVKSFFFWGWRFAVSVLNAQWIADFAATRVFCRTKRVLALKK